ncbi:hypothetical protein CYMTET_37305 [Cymbomonas tetramitiformis]|uniref:Uncharacterized protein n=1 Tax=Cymbomonas tetramitiformis TaxID=36881 RepID=A0AAE0CFI7_9CHLO|nr:hypothetical protein CYMTET_37305 [Cymbomonas tetramitiformis]
MTKTRLDTGTVVSLLRQRIPDLLDLCIFAQFTLKFYRLVGGYTNGEYEYKDGIPMSSSRPHGASGTVGLLQVVRAPWAIVATKDMARENVVLVENSVLLIVSIYFILLFFFFPTYVLALYEDRDYQYGGGNLLGCTKEEASGLCRDVYIFEDVFRTVNQLGTLLSRMMAVYASAKLTLALRSDESTRNETFSRYHQRSWTAQEFVNANHLRVCDQPGIQEAAVTKDEDNIFQELRDMASMEIQQAAPLWLDKRMQPENQPTEADKFFKVIKLLSTSKKVQSSLKFHKLAESVAIFGELEQLVDASVKRDKVLALLPMLSNVVVANIQELSTLVTMCEEASDLFQPLKNRSIKLRTLLEQEDGEASNEKAGGAGVTTMVTVSQL